MIRIFKILIYYLCVRFFYKLFLFQEKQLELNSTMMELYEETHIRKWDIGKGVKKFVDNRAKSLILTFVFILVIFIILLIIIDFILIGNT